VKPNHEVEVILGFIDENVTSFPAYYKANNDSNKENWISNLLVHHLNLCNNEQGGFLPFEFSKNPPQVHSGKETDIGVYAQTRQSKPVTIIEFEAKRFSETSNNKEYVCGARGGMERFKRGEHGSHLPICGMFAYVQSRTSEEWIQKVNTWIDELAQGQQSEIDWSGVEEKLEILSHLNSNIQIQRSTNKRSGALRPITLYHYFLNLN
jgi:hypothetical protein